MFRISFDLNTQKAQQRRTVAGQDAEAEFFYDDDYFCPFFA
jgi:hypothetical protein